jgi:hypothetical protein
VVAHWQLISDKNCALLHGYELRCLIHFLGMASTYTLQLVKRGRLVKVSKGKPHYF